jgi:hypothetical protein
VGIKRVKIKSGSIVWAIVRDHNGFRKRRPVIVLTADPDALAKGPIVVMAITTTFPDPSPPECIELPWNNDRRKTPTGLARRSAAVTNWLDMVYLDEIEETIGIVPAKQLRLIHDNLRKT